LIKDGVIFYIGALLSPSDLEVKFNELYWHTTPYFDALDLKDFSQKNDYHVDPIVMKKLQNTFRDFESTY
jgi:hypothetical protein